MSPMRRLALLGVIALCAPALAATGATTLFKGVPEEGTRTYTNVQVVSIDLVGRTLVVKNATGVEEKVQLDDSLAGFEGIEAGDQVILTLRTGPGWTRVSSISKSKAVPALKVEASPQTSSPPVLVDKSQVLASVEAFGAQVASQAGQADRVDRVWNEFRSACNVSAESPPEGARGWFRVWEGSTRADLSGGGCRELFNQIIDLGEPIKAGMTAAEDVARRVLSPGDVRDIRRRYRMDWDGWALTAPKQLER